MNMVEQSPVVSTTESEGTIDELRLQLDEARSEWADVSSRRQNRMFERRIHGYNDVKSHYNQLVIDYGRQELSEALEDANDDNERKRTVVAYILAKQNALRELTDQTTEGKRRHKLGRAIGNVLTSGSRKAQFAKGALLGAAAGFTGGLMGAGVAGLVAVHFAKGYLTSEVTGMGQTETDEVDLLGDSEEGEEPTTFETLLERAQMESDKIFDADGKEQQVQRRRAAKRGLGAMATGMAFGGVIGFALDGFGGQSASANTGSEGYSAPGMVDTHTGAGIVDTNTNPGLAESTTVQQANPGIIENSSTEYTSPDILAKNAVDTHVNPGLVDADTHTGVGMVETADTHSNSGLIDETRRASPEMTQPADTHANPGLADADTHANPDMAPDTGNGFTVEHGNGYTHELMEAAADNGVDMTTEEAWAAHQAIVDQVGADYIEMTNLSGVDTYSMGDTQYETGISAPGEATWSAEALELVNDATDDGKINDSGVDAPQTDAPEAHDTPNEPTSDSNNEHQPQVNTPDTTTDGNASAERNESRIIERSGLEGLEEANQDSNDWNDMNSDMQRMESLLRDGNFDAVNQNNSFQDTLSYIAYDSEGMTYPNSDIEVLSWDSATERWALNPIPDGSYIPSSVIELVNNYTDSLNKLAA